jgi:O-antigen/teichoic acid export membrane protein
MTGVATVATACRSFFALGIGNYGAMAIGLAVNALLARRLGTEHYGRLALMLMASQLLLLLSVNWSHTGFVRFGSQEFASRGGVGETLWTRLGVLMPAAVLAASAVVLARQPLASYLDIPETGVWLILAHFVAASVLSIVGAVLQAGNQMARYGVCLLLDKAVVLLCLVVLPAAWIATPMRVLACYAASSLAVAAWAVSAVGLRPLQSAFPPLAAYRQMALFSVPLLLSSWAGLFGTNWFDLVILKWYVPISAIGVYSLAAQLAGVVQQVTVIFSTLLLPSLSVMVAERQDARLRMFLERLLPYWLLGTSILFSMVLLAGRVAVPLIFGEPFSGAAPVLALLMVATSALALFNACAPLIAAVGSTWVLTGICFTSAIANVLLDLILIPRFGLAGSAVATIVAYGMSAALVLGFVQKTVGGKVLRLTWLGAPVVLVCACYMVLDGAWVYPVAIVTGSLTVLALVGSFHLFRDGDAAFLRELRLALPFGLQTVSPVGRGA